MTRLRCAAAFVLMLLYATLVSAQTTTVTLQTVDTDGQTWNNGAWTATLYSPPGVPPGPYVILGTSTPVPNTAQSGSLGNTGLATFSLTPNTSIAPAGTQWTFLSCPQATPAQCFQFSISVTGASQTVIPPLPAIRISTINPINRYTAYADTEISGADIGSFYFNLTDLTIHICTSSLAGVCITWVVGGGGGGACCSGLTPGVVPYATTPTTIGNTVPQLNVGLSTANALTFLGSGGFILPSDSVHAGSLQLGGNTTLPSFGTNSVSLVGPASASFTSYQLQFVTTPPTNGQCWIAGTPAGNVIPITFGTCGGGGGVTGSGSAGALAEWTSSSAIGNSIFTGHSTNIGYTGTLTSVSTGTVSNTSLLNSTLNVAGGNEILTTVFTYGCKLDSTGVSFTGTWTSGYCLQIKQPSFLTGVPVSYAGIRVEDLAANNSNVAGRSSYGIDVAAQTQSTGAGSYAVHSLGPNNWAGYTNFSQSKTLVNNSATAFVTLQSTTQSSGQTSNWVVGAHIRYCVLIRLNFTTTTPDFQSDCGEFSVSAINNHGTTSSNLGTTTTTSHLVTSGTLTVTITVTNNGGNVAVNCNANSSLTSPTETLYYDVATFGSDAWTNNAVPQ